MVLVIPLDVSIYTLMEGWQRHDAVSPSIINDYSSLINRVWSGLWGNAVTLHGSGRGVIAG